MYAHASRDGGVTAAPDRRLLRIRRRTLATDPPLTDEEAERKASDYRGLYEILKLEHERQEREMAKYRY